MEYIIAFGIVLAIIFIILIAVILILGGSLLCSTGNFLD